jgi:hypothetical protein
VKIFNPKIPQYLPFILPGTLKELLLFQTIFRLCFEAITTNEENYMTYGK